MLCNLPPELVSLILGLLDLPSLKSCSEACRVLREVCSDSLLNPWHHPVRRAIYGSFIDHWTKSRRYSNQDVIEYPLDVALTDHEAQTLAILAALGTFSCVPRSVIVDILTLSPPRFLLYHSTRSKLPRELWEQAFRRRFLPSWIPHWVHTSQRSSWTWQESFFRILEQINHRLTSNCTSLESWTNYVVILRSGTAATCTAYSRTFSASVIMNDLKRQANLTEYETQARVIVQLADVRIVMMGILRKPPYYAINTHARELIHPPGVERPEGASGLLQNVAIAREPQTSQPLPLPQGPSVSPSNSPTRSSRTPSAPTLTTSRTRSPSRERRTGIGLRLSRTLTHESVSSALTGESSSSRSGSIMNKIRRWTSGSDSRAERTSSPERNISISSPIVSSPTSPSPGPSWATSPITPNTPLNSAPHPVIPVSTRDPINTLPRLQHPEPSDDYAQYPNYTPGENDNRWRIQDGLEEGGLIWVGPIVITAQLVPHNVRRSSTPITAEEVYSEGRHVSFRWDDLIAIAPWMKERLTRRDDGLTI